MMKINKTINLILLVISLSCPTIAQSKVTFQKNVFLINDEPFFPIGWYECNTVEQLKEQRKSGINTVLILWDFFVQSRGNIYSPSGYRNALKSFLITADSINTKVIMQLPYKKLFSSASDPESAITNDDYINNLVPYFKDFPALLGWYLADEPELGENWETQSYSKLQHWYKRIKELDEYHPVFVCIANGEYLINQTLEQNESEVNDNPFRTGKFFDVLMEDHYVLREEDSIPSSMLQEYDDWLVTLFESFNRFNDQNLKTHSTILVTQGYGGGISGFRNPEPSEIKYSVISAIEFAQSQKYKSDFLYNLGGIFFWRYGAANSECKKDINEFINFFVKNSFDEIIRQKNYNYLIVNQYEIPETSSFLRFWKGSYYLFVINRSDRKIKNDLKLKIGSYSNCNELLIPFGKIKRICLKDEGAGIFGLKTTLDRREAKIIKITK